MDKFMFVMGTIFWLAVMQFAYIAAATGNSGFAGGAVAMFFVGLMFHIFGFSIRYWDER